MVDETNEKETQETNEETTAPEETQITVETEKSDKSKEFKTIDAQKRAYREKAEKLEARVKELEAEKSKATQSKPAEIKPFGVEDLVEVTNALEGLDSGTKEYLVRQHKITGKPINEIKQDEDFKMWQEGHRIKLEKEKTLNPSTRPSETSREKNFTEKLEDLDDIDIRKSIRDLEAKEKLLEEKGLWKNPRQGSHQRLKLS